MSVHVMSWVFKHSKTRLAERLVLLVLADHAEADGSNARASIDLIADEALIDQRHVRKCLRQLEACGAIKAMGRTRKGVVVYQVVMTAEAAVLQAGQASTARSEGRSNCPPVKLPP